MTDSPKSDVPDLPIDENVANRVMMLYQRVDDVLDDLKVPTKERKEVERNLMEAVAADLLTRLGGRLSDDEKKELALATSTGAEPDLNLAAKFFRDKFPQEELVAELAGATESVLNDFIKEMGK